MLPAVLAVLALWFALDLLFMVVVGLIWPPHPV